MKYFLASLLFLGMFNVALAQGDDDDDKEQPSQPQEPSAEHQNNPMFELGQVVTCQAMHMVLSRLYITAGAMMAGSMNDPKVIDLAKTQVESANVEIEKARHISVVAKLALVPQLEATGMKDEAIYEGIEKLLVRTIIDVNATVSDPAVDFATTVQLQQFLLKQSVACDGFVSLTEKHHTI